MGAPYLAKESVTMCISIGYYNLHSNMFAMPLGGCDVILGTQWLRTLGPILWDFVEP